MPCDRFEKKALRARTQTACCGPIRRISSQSIRFKTGPIKAEFNGGKRRPNSQFLVRLSQFRLCTKNKKKKRGHLVFLCSTKKAFGEIEGDRKLALE